MATAASSSTLPLRWPRLPVHVLVMVIMCLVSQVCCRAEEQRLKWDVEYIFWSPDGKESMVMGINGTFPGPTIRAKVGDTLHVDVTNKLHTEGVVIHWHGIRMKGTPWADGTASISQCPIAPGETFTYSFTVDKAGTYFYHGHYGMQRSAGLYGSLVVDVADGDKEPFQYDGEFNLLLSDWWHQNVHEQEVGLSSSPLRWINEPQSLLIDGTGQFGCSLAPKVEETQPLRQCEVEQWKPKVLEMEQGKTYRLRIASSTALASLNLAIHGHTMKVVEADGNYVEETDVDNLDIYSGESYSVLLTTKVEENPSNQSQYHWISVRVRGREPKTPPALALVKYLRPGTPNQPADRSSVPYLSFQAPETPKWDDYVASKSFTKKIKGKKPGKPFAKKMKEEKVWTPRETRRVRRIILEGTQITANGYVKWAINNVVLSLPPTPYLGAIKYNIEHMAFNTKPPPRSPAEAEFVARPDTWVYELNMGEVVDVILQNAPKTTGASEIHPWHLHGHDFWVLGYGEGLYDVTKQEEYEKNLLNFVDPPLKNTAVVFPQGWTALRFVADNPGVWAFHCHIEPHLHMGMGVVFAEGVEEIKTMDIPRQALSCGLTGQMMVPETKVSPVPARAWAPSPR